MNKEVSDFASMKPRENKKVANRLYHARGAYFKL
jgi:hypothetical protein